MLCVFTAIYCSFFARTLASDELTEREWKAECAKRRCCMKRDEVLESDMPHVLCEPLSAEECGEHDEYCIWDCNPGHHLSGNTDRHFTRVSPMDGEYEEPHPDFERGTHETFDQCMSSGFTIERDDCGVEYEDMLDQELLKQYCLGNHQSTETTVREHGTDADFEVGDDNSNDNSTLSDRRGISGYAGGDILGHDGRVRIWNKRYNYPYPAVVYFTFADGNGRTHRCTASFISPYWAITAGHCVYGKGDWYRRRKLWSYVHSCSDMKEWNVHRVKYAVTFRSFTQASATHAYYNHPWSWDIAWLRVQKKANMRSLAIGYDYRFKGNLHFNIISYPADKPDCQKFFQSCVYSEWDGAHQQITYDCDTYGGASGSPVYRNNVIYAIHTIGACYDMFGNFQSNNVCNLATRITRSKFKTICKYLNRDTPGICP